MRKNKMADVSGTGSKAPGFSFLQWKAANNYWRFVPAFYFSLFTLYSFAQPTNKAVKDGNDAYRKNDFIAAIDNYQKALQLDAKNVTAKFNMANALQHNNKAGQSADKYDDIISATTDEDLKAKSYYNKALAMLKQNKLDDAITAFEQSLRLSPGDNEARENLQKALETKKQQQPPPPPKPNQKQPPQNEKQQKQQQMNRQMMEQKFKELEEQEKELQKEVQKQKLNTPDNEKDW